MYNAKMWRKNNIQIKCKFIQILFRGVNIISSPIYSNGVTRLQFQFSARNVEMENCRCQRAFESLSSTEFQALLAIVIQLTHFYLALSHFKSAMVTPSCSLAKDKSVLCNMMWMMRSVHHPHHIIFLEKAEDEFIKITNFQFNFPDQKFAVKYMFAGHPTKICFAM